MLRKCGLVLGGSFFGFFLVLVLLVLLGQAVGMD